MKPVLLGKRYFALDAPLRRMGLDPLYLPENPWVDSRLAGHADLSVFPEGERIWLAPYLRKTEIPYILQKYGYSIRFPNILQQQDFPRDAQMNLCPVGNHLLAAKAVHAEEIVNQLTTREGMHPIWIRQGYARCSCCVVDGESLITADRGIAFVCEAAGLQVLLISPGHVDLPGYAYGFLGGASFHLDPDTIAFTGSLQRHPDGERILRFLQERDVTAIDINKGPLLDIGGAFVLNPK